MDAMDNILRIARGGKPITAEMSPAERVMQYALPQPAPTPKDNSAWGRFKCFAGSNGGRTLMGGLGTALAVGLTGGNFKDALGYGVMGAGNTVGVLNRNKQYANQLALKQQERLDAIGKEQRENKFKLDLQDQALAKSKLLADYQLDKTLERLRGENTINQENEAAERQRKINAINSNPFLDENEKQWQIAQLDSGSFNRDAYYTDKLSRDPNDGEALDYFNNQGIVNNLIKPANYTETVLKNADKFTPESFESFSKSGDITQLVPNQKFSSGDLGLVQLMVSDGIPLVDALDRVGKMTPEQKINYEGKKAGAIKEGELPYVLAAQDNKSQNDLGNNITMAGVNNGYNQQQMLLEDKIKRGFEEYKTTLPVESILNAHQEAQALQAQGYNVTAGDILYNSYRKDRLANMNVAVGIGKTRAETQKINRELSQPLLSPVEEVRQKEEAKQGVKLKAEQQKQDTTDVRDFYLSVSEFPILQKQMKDIQNTAGMATGSGLGRMRDATGAFFGYTTDGAENAAKFEAQALNVVLPQLKKIFGGNISDGEREALVKLIGEKDSTVREKQARINAFIANKAALMAQKAASLADRGLIPQDLAQTQIALFENLINPNVDSDGYVIEVVEE